MKLRGVFGILFALVLIVSPSPGFAWTLSDYQIPADWSGHTYTSSPTDWRKIAVYQIMTDRFFDGDPSNNNAHTFSTAFNAPSGDYPQDASRRTLGGDIKGLTDHLDYIKALGFDAVWISSPLFGTEPNGYAPTTYNALDPKLGTVAEFRAFVDAAHARGMYVIVDCVANHFANWFTDQGFNGAGWGTPQYKYGTDRRYGATFGDAIGTNDFHSHGNISDWNDVFQLERGELVGLDDLKTEDAYVRNYVIAKYANMIKALDIDGFRVDAIKHVSVGDWAALSSAWRSAAASVGKNNFYMFGEAYSGSDGAVGYYTGNKAGTGTKIMNGMMDYVFYMGGMPWKLFTDPWGLKNWVAGMNNANYDMGQGNGTTTWSYGNLNLHFVDNHDQARFLSSGDWDRMLSVVGLITMIEGVGGVYYGSEQAFNTTGTDGRGAYAAMFDHPFQSDNAAGDNFNQSYWLYKKIARLMAARRRLGDALGSGTTLYDPQNGIFAFRRSTNDFIAINTTNAEKTATYNIGVAGRFVNLVDSTVVNGPSFTITLPKYEVGVWIKDGDPVLEPMVVSATPSHGASYSGSSVALTFDQDMDPAATVAAASMTPSAGGTWSVSGKVLTLSGAAFAPGVTYTVRVERSARAAGPGGKSMYGGYVQRFRGSYASPVVTGNVVTFNYSGGSVAKLKGTLRTTGGSNGSYTGVYDATWNAGAATPMVLNNGLWSITLTLEPNKTYEYGFEIDGAWTNDPINTNHATSGNDRFTTGNSVSGSDSVPPAFAGLTSASDAQSSGKINLSWPAATDSSLPVKYNIYWTNDTAAAIAKTYVDSTPNATSNGTSYQATGLTNGYSYWFIVRAEDATSGNGGPSGGKEDSNLVERGATPSGVSSPVVSGNVVRINYVGGTLTKVKGSWRVTSGTNGTYTAVHDTQWNGGVTSSMVLNGSVWTCTFTLDPGKTWEYGFDVDGAWTNDPLNADHATNGNDRFVTANSQNGDSNPPVFSGLTSATDATSGGKVNLSWSAASDSTAPVTYNIYWTNDTSAQVSKSYVDNTPDVSTTSTTYQASGLLNGRVYYFVVRAEDATGGNLGPRGGNQDTNLVERSTTPTGNAAPTATAQSVSTNQNTSKIITLVGSDANGDALSFAIASSPTKGTISSITTLGASSAQVTYTPNQNVNGTDQFTFTVSDGTATSSAAAVSITVNAPPSGQPAIYVAFHWHMHQPIYWPDENVVATQNNGRYGFSVTAVHSDRGGPYTSWPADAVQNTMNNGLAHGGAQVSFTGSLTENLNTLESNGWGFSGWKNRWRESQNWNTTLGNKRLDIVLFPYFHSMQPLIPAKWVASGIRRYKDMYFGTWSTNRYSKGMFPAENSMSDYMIPPLVDEGVEWVMVDSVHFDRAAQGYPWNSGGNLYEPNPADQINANPNDWVQLNNLWAPTKVSGRWGHQPHYAQYVDPSSGQVKKIIVVPTERYMGNEDGRGGFGALQYESVMSQLEPYNTDPAHPILIVLHHDGDNYGGGTEAYYHSNFDGFVNWVKSNPTRFVNTTIQDYLQMFPPDPTDVIHIEPGSWSGADNGDPEYKKWNGDAGTDGYSPDRNSWMTLMAAINRVETAEQINAGHSNVATAKRKLEVGMTSCYWYWDGSPPWDYHVTRACNEATYFADQVISTGSDQTNPTIYLPQRDPYNPGGKEWNIQQGSDLKIFSPVYDVSGLRRVELKYRIDNDGVNPIADYANELYAGGSGVAAWQTLTMSVDPFPASRSDPAPTYRANIYAATITGITDKLIDYYVEAEDFQGNIGKSVIQHVKFGVASGGGGTTPPPSSVFIPSAPTQNDTILISWTKAGKLHWGVNNWKHPDTSYRPSGTVIYNSQALQTPLGANFKIVIGPFNNSAQPVTEVNFVFNGNDGSWDNNGGLNWKIPISVDNAAPAAPASPVLTSRSARVDVTWAANTEADLAGYRIYRNTVSNGQYALVASPAKTATQFEDTGVSNGTTYFYILRAADNSGNLSDSSSVAAALPSATDTIAPSIPSGFAALAQQQAVTLTWSRVIATDLQDYLVLKSASSGSGYSTVATLDSTVTSYVHTGLTAGDTAYYILKARDVTGNVSDSSAVKSAVPLPDPIPAAPTGVTAYLWDGSARLSWNKNSESDLAGYHVHRASSPGGPYTRLTSSLLTDTQYTDTPLTNGTTYYYVIISKDTANGESANSSEVSATPAPLINVSFRVDVNGLLGVSDVRIMGDRFRPPWHTGSNVLRDHGNGIWGETYSLPVASLKYKYVINGSSVEPDFATSSGKREVTVVDQYGDSRMFVSNRWGQLGDPFPASPAGLVASSKNARVDLRWNRNLTEYDVVGYRLYRSTTSGSGYSQIGTLLNDTGYADLSVTNGETYYYLVRAEDLAKQEGQSSNEVRATPGPNVPPAVPSGVSALSGNARATLTWTANTEPDLAGYHVLRSSTSGGSYARRNTDTVISTSYIDTGLTNGDTYYYVVQSVDREDSRSAYSTEVRATPKAPDTTPPSAPTSLAATAGDRRVTLTWAGSPQNDTLGYNIYRSLSSSGPFIKLNGSIVLTPLYADNSVTNGIRYYYLVRALDQVFNESDSTAVVNATPMGSSGGIEERAMDGDYMDWKASDVRYLDKHSDNTYLWWDVLSPSGTALDPGRDLMAVYTREGANDYYFRVDFFDLAFNGEASALDLYVALDFIPGAGQSFLPDFVDATTSSPWELCLAIYDGSATGQRIYKPDWTTVTTVNVNGTPTGPMRGVKFHSQQDAVEFAIAKQVLIDRGWTSGMPINLQVYTTRDGTNNGLGEAPQLPDITDAIPDANVHDGVIDGTVSTDSTTGRSKYSAILHGNQSLNEAGSINKWIRDDVALTPNNKPSGYHRALQSHEAFKLPVNIHVSGSLAAVLDMANSNNPLNDGPTFNQLIADFVDDDWTDGRMGHMIGGVYAEHIMPYFRDDASIGAYVNSTATQYKTDVLMSYYGLARKPRVFWIPERVVDGMTLGNVVTDARTGQPSNYTATVLDEITHLHTWFGGGSPHKIHKINGVLCFMINDMPDDRKFWSMDGGLNFEVRKLMLDLARDTDQEQLVLVFDDWEAYAGRSFASQATINENPDQYENTIRWIANHPWIEVVTLEQVLDRNWTPIEHGTNLNLPKQTYQWLLHASENNYDNWYFGSGQEASFQNTIPVLTGKQYGVKTPIPSGKKYGSIWDVGTILRDVWDEIKSAPSNELKKLAEVGYSHLIYESAWHDEDNSDKSWDTDHAFVYPDITSDNISFWALDLHGHVRQMSAIVDAAKWANDVSGGTQTATTVVQTKDVDHDGELEYILKNNRVYGLFENDGGRMVMGFAYDATRGGIELIGNSIANAAFEGEEEDVVRRVSALVDMNDAAYVNALYTGSTGSDTVGFNSPDGKIKKSVRLQSGSGTFDVTYNESVAGALNVRIGLVGNLYDMVYTGERKIQQIGSSNGTFFGIKNTNGGQVYVTFNQTTMNTSLNDGSPNNTNSAFVRQLELSGSGNFTFGLTLNTNDALYVADTPAAPVGLVAAPSNGRVSLTWAANGEPNLAGYNVYKSSTSGGPYTKCNVDTVLTASYSVSGLTNGDTYYFVVRALSTKGVQSANSAQIASIPITAINVTLTVDLRSLPTYGIAQVAGNLLTPSWTPGPFAMSANGSGTFSITLPLVIGTVLQYKYVHDTSVWENDFTTTHKNREILVLDQGGGKMIVNNKWNVAGDPAPAVPNSVSLEIGSDTIRINWIASADFDVVGYNVYRAQTIGGPYVRLAALGRAQTYLDSGLTSGTRYYYVVRSQDQIGQESVNSSEVNGLPGTNPPPAQVAGVAATAGVSQITVTWNANTEGDLAGYNLYYSVYLNGVPTKINSSPITATSYVHQNLSSNFQYTYMVAAVDNAGNEGLWSAPVNQTPRPPGASVPIYIAYHWHMHQPIYWPYENIVSTYSSRSNYSYVRDVLGWPDRVDAYTHNPIDNISRFSYLPNWGAQISYSGSLIENIDNMSAVGHSYYGGWHNRITEGHGWQTTLGNRRTDLVAFGYHHPLMPLINYRDLRLQVQMHRRKLTNRFGNPYSKGMFPPESAFSTRMIPALKDEGIEWVMVDNLHLDHANKNFPWTIGEKINPPNRAEQMNNPQADYVSLSCQTNTSYKISVPFSVTPHYAKYVDPATGVEHKIIVVPLERTLGYDDSYGDRTPQQRLEAFLPYNTDPNHPMLVVLAHDGDNAGASGFRYYVETMGWLGGADPNKFRFTTVQDYLSMFPPDPNDVVHVADGSWVGADLGDQELKKWMGDPYRNGVVDFENGYSSDWNSWMVITAGKNRLLQAEAIQPTSGDIGAIVDGTGNTTDKAWHQFLVGEASCYWYWDGTVQWDEQPTRATNAAMTFADQILGSGTPGGGVADNVAPTIFPLQREPYNPGSEEAFKGVQPSDFDVFTFIYDAAGVSTVNLKYRVDADGENPLADNANEIYSGGTGVGPWISLPMAVKPYANPPAAQLQPTYRATVYTAKISGFSNSLLDYYVEATDGRGNIGKSDIHHVFVGQPVTNNPVNSVWLPASPSSSDTILITGTKAGYLHWGINGWVKPDTSYWPAGTTAYDNFSVETRLDANMRAVIGPFNQSQSVARVDFVFRNDDGTWGKNNGADYRINLSTDTTPPAMPSGWIASSDNAKVNLAWTLGPEQDLTGYRVYRATDTAGPYTLIASPGRVTAYADNGLTNGTTYYYRLRAADASNNLSDTTATASATPSGVDVTAPSKVTGVALTAQEFAVRVTWTGNLAYDLAGYRLYRSTTSSASGYSLISSPASGATGYTDGGLNASDTHYYVITAVDSSGNVSDSSTAVAAKPLSAQPPAIPAGVAATAGDSKVTLSWTANTESDLAGYNIYRSTSSTNGFVKDNSSVQILTVYNVNNLSNDTPYYFVVRAVDTGGAESDSSAVVSATPKGGITVFFKVNTSALGTVASAQIAGNKFTPAWTPSATPMSTQGAGIFSVSKLFLINERLQYKYIRDTTSWESNFPANESVNREITVVDQGGGRMFVNNIWNVDGDALPSAPSNLSATPGNAQVSLAWTAVSDFDLAGYNVYRSTTSGSGYSKIASRVASVSYICTGLTNNTTYYFKVIAEDSAVQEGSASNEVSAKPSVPDTTAPSVPTGVDAFVSGAAIDIKWNRNSESDVAGYRVYRRAGTTGSYAQQGNLISDTKYSDAAVSAGVAYYYVVRAQDSAGNVSDTSASDTASITGNAIAIDGASGEWIGTAPSADRTSAVSNGEWIWKDPSGDHRTDGADPDGNYDLKEARFTGDVSGLSMLFKFDDISANSLPYITLGVDKDQLANSGEQWFGQYLEATMNNSAWRDYEVIINGNKTGHFGAGSGGWTWKDTGTSFISATNNLIEANFKWYSMGVTLPKKVRFTVAVAQNNNGEPSEVFGVDILDAITDASGNTWTDVSDGQLDYFFDIGFNADGKINTAPEAPLWSGPADNSVLTNSTVNYLWTWRDSDGLNAISPQSAFEIARDTLFTQSVLSETVAGFRTARLYDYGTNGDYYTRVRTRDDFEWSPWSSTIKITINQASLPDANPANWVGVASTTSNTFAIDAGEWIWTDATLDERTDAADPDANYDLKELRLAGDTGHLYILAKFRDLTNTSLPYLSLALDKDRVFAGGERAFGGSSETQMDTKAFREYELVMNSVKTGFYGVGAGGFVWSESGSLAMSTTNDALEARYHWEDMGIVLPAALRFTAMTASNSSGSTAEIYQPDVLDALTTVSGNTWSEAQDGVINYHFDVNFNRDGRVNAKPGKPVLLSPANAVTINSQSVTFAWSCKDPDSIATANPRYRFQIATDPEFANFVSDYTYSGLLTAYTYVFQAGNRYYWRVQEMDDFETSPWSDARDFRVDFFVPPVTLTAPVNNTETSNAFVRFAWTQNADDLSGLDTFVLSVSTTPSFSSVERTARTVDPGSWQFLTKGETTYYWRVTALDKAGNQETSAVWSFRLDTGVRVSLTSPDSGYRTNDTTPSFSWTSPDGDTYQLQVSASSAFSTLLDNASTTSTSYTPSALTYPQNTYYWRVIATDRTGNTTAASPRVLIIDTDVSVTLQSPADLFDTSGQRPSFAWTGTADTYQIQVSKQSAFTTLTDSASATQTAYTPGANYAADTYYWRVTGFDFAGNSSTSSSRRFVIDTGVRADLFSPADLTETSDATPPFAWTGTGDTYTFEISTSAGFSTVTDSVSVTVLTYTPSAVYPANTYYWRVTARNSSGSTKTTPARAIKIDTSASASLSSPADSYRTNTLRPAFSWTGDGSQFTVEISKTSGFGTIFDSRTAAAAQFTPAADYPADTYYWRVTALDTAGNSSTSSSRTLFIDTAVSVTLASPASLLRTSSVRPAFSWTGDADTYQYQISRASAFGVPFDTQITTTTSHTPTGNYPADTYYWRVVASDAAGNSVNAAWTALIIDTWVSVALATPADSFITNGTSPIFSWTSDGETFEIQISKSTAFTTIFDSKTTALLNYTPAGYSGDTYYWRVIARDGAGNFETSSYRRLVIDTLVIVNMVSPLAAHETSVLSPTFVWSGNADTYLLQISRTLTFSSVIDSLTTTGTSHTPSSAFAADTYFWRLTAYYSNGNVIVTTARSVKLDTGVAIVLSSPAHQSKTNSVNPPFSWGGDADTYRLDVSRVGDFSTLFDSRTTTATSYTPSKTYLHDTYYWRLSGMDVRGNVDTAATRILYVDTGVQATQLLPAANHRTNALRTALSWSGDADNSYRVEISKNSAFSTIFDSVTTTGVAYTPAFDYPEDTYYWRVTATDDVGNTVATSARAWTVDTQISAALATPSDLSVTNDSTPTFAWTGDGDTFTLQVARDNSFGGLADLKATSSTTYTPNGYSSDTYFWRVVARDNAGNLVTTAARTLVVDLSVSVQQSSPAHLVKTNDTTPDFSWSGSGDTYTIQISTSSTFATIFDSQTSTGSSFQTSKTYPADTYYWRVTAFDRAGNVETTTARTFAVVTGIVINAVSPASMSHTGGLRPPFAWSGTGETYVLQIARTNSFASLFDSLTTSNLTYTPSANYPADTYYWRVVVKDAAGNIDTSAAQTLVIDTAISVSQSLPVDGLITSSTSPAFTWSGDAETFTFQISRNSSFSPLIDSAASYPADTYYWRVLARDRAGNMDTSPSRTLTIDTSVTVALSMPLNLQKVSSNQPVFVWTGDAETYVIEISRLNNFSTLFDSRTLNATLYATAQTYIADTYFWRVIAFDRAGNVETAARTLVIDTNLSLLQPIQLKQTNDTRLAFVWKGSAASFLFQISTDSAFSTITDSRGPGADTSHTPSGFYPANIYYWRVATSTDTTDYRTLIIDTSVTASLSVPADGHKTNDTRPAFAWTGDADTYTIQVSKVSTFSTLVDNQILTTGAYTPSTPYVSDTYFWRVRAVDRAGNSSTSSSRTLIVDTSVFVSPNAPANLLQTKLTQPAFTWSGDGETYLVEVAANDPTFSTVYETRTVTTSAFVPSKVLVSGIYFWRVTARKTTGNLAVSPIRTLYIDTSVRVTPQIPPTDSVVPNFRPFFSWTGDAETYLIQASVSPTLATILDSRLVTTVTYLPAIPYPSVTIFWRLVAFDAAGNVDTSPIRSFRIAQPFDSMAIRGVRFSRNFSPADTRPFITLNGKVNESAPIASFTITNNSDTVTSIAIEADSATFKFEVTLPLVTGRNSFVAKITDSTGLAFYDTVKISRVGELTTTRLGTGGTARLPEMTKYDTWVGMLSFDDTSVKAKIEVPVYNPSTGTYGKGWTVNIQPKDSGTSLMMNKAPDSIALKLGSASSLGSNFTFTAFEFTLLDTDGNSIGGSSSSFQSVSLGIDPTGMDLGSNLVTDLKLYTYNEQTLAWEAVSGSGYNPTTGLIEGNLVHLSIYAILPATAVSADLSGLVVYPNPFKPNSGNPRQGTEYTGAVGTGITFANLTQNATVKIYTMDGVLVDQEYVQGLGRIVWDARNSQGRLLASGVYLYIVESGTGEKKTGKLAIVR